MSNFRGWFKNVFAEGEAGHHVVLEALFYCETVEQAKKLERSFSATHLRYGQEALERESFEVYLSGGGKRFVVFDWNRNQVMIPLEVDSQF